MDKRRNHIWPLWHKTVAWLHRFLLSGVAAVLLAPLWFFPVKRCIQSAQFARIHALESHSRELIAFAITPENPVTWVEKDREFYYVGMMYDIHSMTTSGDTLHVLALPDPYEAFWYRVFFSSGLSSTGTQQAAFFFLFYFLHLVSEPSEHEPPPPVQQVAHYALGLPEFAPPLISPPPEHVGKVLYRGTI